MSRKSIFLVIATLILGSSIFYSFKPQQEGIKWMTIQQALEAQKKAPKKIFIDVYTDWCGWCKKMDATSFQHPEVVKYMNENFYAVKFNAEVSEKIKWNGKEYDFIQNGGRGYHGLAADWMANQMSYPTTVYLDEKGAKIFPVPGYLDPKNMEMVLNYVGSNGYQKGPWEEYQKTFVGKVK